MLRHSRRAIIALAVLIAFPSCVAAEPSGTEIDCNDLTQLQKSAQQNNPTALFQLAVMYNKGVCVPQDWHEGAALMGRSARLGYSRAQYIAAAEFHANGEDNKALDLARRSAEQGDPRGQNLYGFLLMSGKGLVNDDNEAAKWLRRSAEQGHSGSQVLLAQLYSEGRGVTQDYVEADKWLILGNREKDPSVGLIATQKAWELTMSQQNVAEAHRRANAWKPKTETLRQ
jgi:TPR repeat protein